METEISWGHCVEVLKRLTDPERECLKAVRTGKTDSLNVSLVASLTAMHLVSLINGNVALTPDGRAVACWC
jgi:hypothetical protein